MSTNFGDADISRELATSIDEGPCDIGELSHGQLVGLTCLFQCVQVGGWCDFDDTDEFSMHAGIREYLDALPCRPLLEPWLESKAWTREQVGVLKTAHRLQS